MRRKNGVFEGDDPADQVDPRVVGLGGNALCAVVGLRGADPPGERTGREQEADGAVLVLDVELERIQPRNAEVFVDLPG